MYAAAQQLRNERATDDASYPGGKARLSHRQKFEFHFRMFTRLRRLKKASYVYFVVYCSHNSIIP